MTKIEITQAQYELLMMGSVYRTAISTYVLFAAQWYKVYKKKKPKNQRFEFKRPWVLDSNHGLPISMRYPMKREQAAQISCRVIGCRFNIDNGECENMSPALSLYPTGTFSCHSQDIIPGKAEAMLKQNQ